MLITIGMYTYLLIKSCSTLATAGGVGYPLDDSAKDAQQRTMIVCADYGSDQTREVYIHEVTHACLHDHPHHFKDPKELQEHIKTIKEQPEELLVSSLAACIETALENTDATVFLGIKQNNNNRSSGGSVLSRASQVVAEDKFRHSSKQ